MDQYVNERRAAEITGFARGTLRNMRSQGRGPVFVKVAGHAVRYRVRDLEAWLKGEAA